MTPNEQVVDYILRNGRNLSWHEMALKFGCANGDAARNAWRRDKIKHPHLSDLPATTIAPPSRVLNPEARIVKEAYVIELEDRITRFEEDLTKGTATVEALVGQEIRTLDELVEKCKVDLTKWEVAKYTQNFWNNKYQVKALLVPKSDVRKFQENFMEFLKTYAAPLPLPEPPIDPIDLDRVFVNQGLAEFTSVKGCLIINKQDLHFDKFDITGNNDIKARFRSYEESVIRIVKKAELSYLLSDIIYLIGSDEFNSEWTGTTTKGTPQKNLIDYHNGFAAICNHEVHVINKLCKPGRKVKVLYMPGNHDEYVGWHLITWLATYYKDSRAVEFDVSPAYRKYAKFGTTAMMFNHGDAIKPQKLASIFPQEFKDQWSTCDYQYIFTGDKHHEMSLDIDGILFYQLTQGSNAKSLWDDKNGFINKGFLTAFVINEKYGLADTYHERL